MIDLSLKQLEVFAAVAEYNSFTQAAEMLYLSQSTVSSHVKNLENALGVQLFNRSAHRKMELTEEGRRIYGVVREILDRCQELQDCLGSSEQLPILTVAASTVPAQYLLPKLLAEFSQQDRSCRFLLKRGDSLKVHQMLQDGEAQLGFVGLKMDEKQFHYFPIFRDHLVVITANSPKYQALSQLDGERLLLQENIIAREEESGTWQMTAAWLRHKSILPQSLHLVARMETPEAIRRAVAQGMGISVMSSLAAEEDVAAGRLLQFELGSETLWRQLYAVSLQRPRSRIPLTGRFQRFLEEWTKSQPPLPE